MSTQDCPCNPGALLWSLTLTSQECHKHCTWLIWGVACFGHACLYHWLYFPSFLQPWLIHPYLDIPLGLGCPYEQGLDDRREQGIFYMALLDRLATVPAQSPMMNLNFRQAVHITQLEVTRGGLKMTPWCRCYIFCVEGKWLVTGTSDQSHTMKRNLFPPISKELLMTGT